MGIQRGARLGDRASNGVFMLVAQPERGHMTWTEREAIREELTRRLQERERIPA